MPAKRFWAQVALMSVLAVTGCRSWCENHYPCPQPVSYAQPCCNPCYQAPTCCTPAPNPCAPAPAYAPPPPTWSQQQVAPIPAQR